MTKMKIHFLILLFLLTLFFPSSADALIKKSGDIELITEEPLFPSTVVWYPGLRIEKSFQAKNRGHGPKKVEIEAMSELVTKNLAGILQFEVKEGTKTLFGGSTPKTLKNFFDSGTLELSEVWVNDDGKIYALIVTMPDIAGNEYQGGKVSFDLRVGFPGDANSSIIISSNTTTSMTASTALPTSVPAGRSLPLVLGESVSPTPTTVPANETIGGNLSNQGNQGQVDGENTENQFPWYRLIIIFSLLISGTLILMFFRRNRL